MRKDVKIGLALSLAVVILAGWYYTRGSNKNRTIPLAQGPQPTAVGDPHTQQVTPVRPAPGSVSRPAPRPATVAQPQTQPVSPQVAMQRPTTTSPAAPPVTTTIRPPVSSPSREVAANPAAPALPSTHARGEQPDADDIVGPPDRPAVKATLADASATRDSAGGSQASPGWSTLTPPAATAPAPAGAPPSAATNTTTTPATVPSDAAVESYTVKSGDSFATIAEVYYGSQRYADFLVQSNPQVSSPNGLRPGMVLKIPAKPQSPTASVAVAKPAETHAKEHIAIDGAKLYLVRANDTFYGIAERELGSSNRWKEIYDLNKERVGNDPKGLHPGMTLRMPEGAKKASAPQAASATAPAVPSKPASLTATVPDKDSGSDD